MLTPQEQKEKLTDKIIIVCTPTLKSTFKKFVIDVPKISDKMFRATSAEALQFLLRYYEENSKKGRYI